MKTATKRLAGWRVLVPRGGEWGAEIAEALEGEGAIPVVAPLIDRAPAPDPEAVRAALDRLSAGTYDWLAVTSAAAVDVLVESAARLAPGTRVAVVGGATARACRSAGLAADLVPEDESAGGLLAAWPARRSRVLVLASDLAASELPDGLRDRGHDVDAVIAYRTVSVELDPRIRAGIESGRIRAVLVTSGSVARALLEQIESPHPELVVACIGPRTAAECRAAGLNPSVVADERTGVALVAALAAAAGGHP